MGNCKKGNKGYVTVVANQKGGVGKTTTAHALVTGLAQKGYKSLAIDTDPQGNLTYTMKADESSFGVYELLKGVSAAADTIQHTPQGDIIASSLMLAGADMEFTETGREYILSEVLETIKKEYDYIIIDTPPTLGILTINALTAARDVVIPMGADIYSLQGLSQLYNTINKVKKRCNTSLRIAGLLITRYNGRAILSQELKETIEETAGQIGTKPYLSIIREGIAIKETQTRQVSLFDGKKSNPAADYISFVDEYLMGVAE